MYVFALDVAAGGTITLTAFVCADTDAVTPGCRVDVSQVQRRQIFQNISLHIYCYNYNYLHLIKMSLIGIGINSRMHSWFYSYKYTSLIDRFN